MQIDDKGRFDPRIREENFQLVGYGNRSRFGKFDPQRTINFYQVYDQEGKKPAALFPTPGSALAFTLPGGTTARPGGSLSIGNKQYQISGSTVYQIDTLNNVTTIGTLSTATGPVGMIFIYNTTTNSLQIVIVDGTFGWIYDTVSGTFAKITAMGFPANPNAITTMDGYVVVSQGGTGNMAVSALGNPNSWPGKINMQTLGENVIQLATLNKRILAFGDRVTEIFYNAGIATNIFNADYNLKFEYGCVSPASVAVGYGRAFWLAAPNNGPPQLMMSDGTFPQAISDENVDRILATYEDPSDCVGNIWKGSGVTFYEASFTTDNQTWLYNVGTKTITERAEQGNRAALQTYTYFNGQGFIGTYNDNKIYYFDEAYADNNGTAIQRTRITSIFSHPCYRPIAIHRLIVDCLVGQILNPILEAQQFGIQGADLEPYLYLSVSRDGGVTFDAPQKRLVGEMGDYKNRVLFDNLGQARAWVFRFDFYARSIQAIFGASLEYNVVGA